MHSHNDELNRLLDSLTLGASGGSFDLDRDTIETSSRFMHANASMSAPADFASRLEDSLMKLAAMTPVAISGRIEHIGEGIGLVAASPLPRRIRFERIAVLAAVVLLLLAAGGFYRSDSDKGGNWLLAPVASASPASDVAQACVGASAETIAEVRSANYQSLYGWGLTRNLSFIPSQYFSILPESMLPDGPSPDAETIAAIEPLVVADWSCWRPTYVYDLEITDITIISMFQLDDGRVGARLSMKVNGTPIHGVTIYAPVISGWTAWESAFALSDAELTATTYLNAGTSWKTQMYETASATGQRSQFIIREMRVPAGEPVELTVENVGTVDQQFTISNPGSSVDETLKPGETKTVTITFSPGWHLYSTIGEGDIDRSAFGYIFAVDPGASTPVASASPAANTPDCPNGEELRATQEANGNPTFFGIQGPAIFPAASPPAGVFANTDVHMQPAPNDPEMLIQVTALSDIPENDPPSQEVWDELAGEIPFDLYCFYTRDQSLLTSPINITRMTTLSEGRVAVLLESDPFGYGTQFFMTYVQGTQQWLPEFMSFAIPDSQFVAPSDLEIQSIVLLQGWNSDEGEVHSSNGWPSPVGVPANTDVIFDVKNLGSEPLTFTITGTDVNVVLAVDEQRDIVVNLEPGVYRYSFSRPTDTIAMEPGFIFAEQPNVSTPMAGISTNFTAADCPSGEEYMASVEANGIQNFSGLQFPATMNIDESAYQGEIYEAPIYVQPAPNNPSSRIQVIALSAVPKGEPASAEVASAIEDLLPLDLYCFAPRNTPLTSSPTSITRMFMLPDGNVGILLSPDPGGFGLQLFTVYAPGSQQWVISSMMFVLPDTEFVAPSNLPVETRVLLEAWNADQEGVDTTSAWPDAVQVPAGTDVTITAKNMGSLPIHFSIPGTTVSVELGLGESQDIVVNLGAGVYNYRFAGTSGDPGVDIGFIFVADVQATPAAATPAASGSVYCLPQDAWVATATANGIRTDYAQVVTNPTQITAPNVPDEKIWAVAESQLPPLVTVAPDLSQAFAAALQGDLDCAIEARGGAQNYNPKVISITQLADGRIGVLIDQDLVGLGVEQYLIYAPGDPGWLLYEIAYVVPDEELLANIAGPIQTSINIDLWTTQATDSQSQSCSPAKVRIAAGQPIDLTVRNLSLLPLTVSIPGVSIEESIAAGATSKISATFESGVYLFSSSNPADTSPGTLCVIFATMPVEPAATPTT